MNIWSFTGNLGKDAEVRYSASGMAICSFPVAVKSGYGDKEKTTWVICTLFGKRAEGRLPEFLIKGAQIAISGESFLDEWEDKEGLKRSTLKVNVNNLDLVGGRPDASSEGGGGDNRPQTAQQPQAVQQTTQPAPQAASPAMDSTDDFNDDLPF